MTIKNIKKRNIMDEIAAKNIRHFLKQPCFTYNFNVEPVGVIKDKNEELVLILKNLKNDPEISRRGSYVECFFSNEDAAAPYKTVAGLSIAE